MFERRMNKQLCSISIKMPVKNSITIENMNGDSRHPCLIPQVLVKKHFDSPFISKEKDG